jgi:hypothetical protein
MVNGLMIGPVSWFGTGALRMDLWLDQCSGLELVPCEWAINIISYYWTKLVCWWETIEIDDK